MVLVQISIVASFGFATYAYLRVMDHYEAISPAKSVIVGARLGMKREIQRAFPLGTSREVIHRGLAILRNAQMCDFSYTGRRSPVGEFTGVFTVGWGCGGQHAHCITVGYDLVLDAQGNLQTIELHSPRLYAGLVQLIGSING
jgi:hypothetical protein